jgi:hypothetical protein
MIYLIMLSVAQCDVIYFSAVLCSYCVVLSVAGLKWKIENFAARTTDTFV